MLRSAAACSASDLTSERTQFISFIINRNTDLIIHGAVLFSIYVGLCVKCLSFCAILRNWDCRSIYAKISNMKFQESIIRRYTMNSIGAKGRTDITS
jgi:hypothetical protein